MYFKIPPKYPNKSKIHNISCILRQDSCQEDHF